MRKIHLLALLATAASLTAAAQSKFDAQGLAIMHQYDVLQANPNATLFEMPSSPVSIQSMSRAEAGASIFITLEQGYTAADLEARGFEIVADAGDIVLAYGSLADIKALEDCDFVKAMSFGRQRHTLLDHSRAVTGGDEVHAGTGLDRPYTGKGIICGIYDSGVDPNHANFLDPDSKALRIGSLWNLSVDANTEKVTVREYSNAMAISDFETDSRNDTHGTHTLGCMAGSYNRKGGSVAILKDGKNNTSMSNKNPYYGLAYESELAVGCGSLHDASILKAVDLIINYAKKQNKPVVINLSIGDNLGAHDQYDATNKMLDKYGDDAIICIAAGNDGGSQMSLDKTLTASETSISTFYFNEAGGSGALDIWSDSSEPFTVTAFVYNLSTNKIEYQRDCGGGAEEVVVVGNSNMGAPEVNPTFNSAFSSSFFRVSTSKNASTSNRYNAYLYASLSFNPNTNADKNLVFGIKVTGKAGQRIMMSSMSDNLKLRSLGKPGITDGDDSFSINGMACGTNVITVGAWNARNEWASVSYGKIGYGSSLMDNVGGVAYFSSYGRLVDNRTLPLVCAPGVAIVSSISTYYYDALSDRDKPYITAKQTFNNRTNYWAAEQGTSMSTPIVAGGIALWLEADPTLTTAEVQDIIAKTSTTDNFVTAGDIRWGAGKFNVLEGLKYILNLSSVSDVVADNGDKFIINATGDNAWNVYMPLANEMNLALYNTAGQLVKTATATGSEVDFDANGLAKGVYVLNINGLHSTRLIIR